jgi:hypothetical protein
MRIRLMRDERRYAAIPNEVMRNSDLSLEARGMIALMMGYSDDWIFYRNHLLEVANIGREKFYRVITELQNAGYIEVVSKKSSRGTFAGTTYIIHDEPASVESLKDRPSVGSTAACKTVDGKPVSGSAVSGSAGDGKPDHIRRPTLKEDLLEEDLSKKNQTRDFFGSSEGLENVVPKPTVEDQFEEWFKLYPERKNNPKKPALIKFRYAIQKTTFERLKSAISAYARSRIGEDPTYTVMATTWLNQDRWAEHVEAKEVDHKENPFEGLPPHMAQSLSYFLDIDEKRKIALDYWERQESAE